MKTALSCTIYTEHFDAVPRRDAMNALVSLIRELTLIQ